MAATTPDDSPTDPETDAEEPEWPDGEALIEELDVKTSKLAPVQEWRARDKRKKLARKGYIEWYLIDGAWPKPKFIKPEQKGRGILEYEHDDKTYLFPIEAAVPNELSGMRTIIHHVDDSKPINVQEPGKPAIDPASLKRYLDMGTTVDPPSWLSSLGLPNMAPEDLVKYAVYGFIVYIVYQGAVGGGGVPLP